MKKRVQTDKTSSFWKDLPYRNSKQILMTLAIVIVYE